MRAIKDTTISVKVPEVRLQLRDVSYLRAVAAGEMKSNVSESSLDRLSLLGLIKYAEVERTAEELKELRAKKSELRKAAAFKMKADRWEHAASICYDVCRVEKRMAPFQTWTITDAGKKLLSTGEIRVKMQKGRA